MTLLRPDPAAAAGSAQAEAALFGAVDRLESVVDLETETLKANRPADLKAFNHRKSHGLLELSRSMRPFEGAPLAEPVRARLAVLRAKLDENRSVLSLHLRAMQEISSIIARAMEEAESDGTYSAGFR